MILSDRTVLLAALAAIVEGEDDIHEHRCPCGMRWQHRSTDAQGRGHDHFWAEHTCRRCGTRCVNKYPCAPKARG